MKTVEPRVERRAVIEAYVAYECSKKHLSPPTLSEWDWTSADAIDEELRRSRLKPGVLAGYMKWNKVELAIPDLSQCAVVVDIDIFPGRSRALGEADKAALEKWTPEPEPAWYGHIVLGQPLRPSDPLILRPALTGEPGAKWYVEDGSGRAVALVKFARLFSPLNVVATAYLGVIPDPDSRFMKKSPFNELLCAGASPARPTMRAGR